MSLPPSHIARFVARNRGEILDVTRINIPGPINSPYGKLDYLLGRVPKEDSKGKGGLFAGVMGFTDETLAVALHSHLVENLGEMTLDGSKIIVEGVMTGANGRIANIRSVWQVTPKGAIELVTAYRSKKRGETDE
ncbi:hypothetical protein HYR99_32840 [Candidatus Poribacteria bacterium]|nr:hypothetical protein [Candidatus Poribacteria bacterium]